MCVCGASYVEMCVCVRVCVAMCIYRDVCMELRLDVEMCQCGDVLQLYFCLAYSDTKPTRLVTRTGNRNRATQVTV